MASRYDLENLLADVKALLVGNFNTALAAVEVEKESQGLPVMTLLPVDPIVGYFQQGWSPQNMNINPAIVFGVQEILVEGAGPATKKEYVLFIDAVLVDRQEDLLINQRVLRYSRALEDVFHQNYDRLPSASRIKIKTVLPLSFKLDQDSSEEIHIGGVQLTTSLA